MSKHSARMLRTRYASLPNRQVISTPVHSPMTEPSQPMRDSELDSDRKRSRLQQKVDPNESTCKSSLQTASHDHNSGPKEHEYVDSKTSLSEEQCLRHDSDGDLNQPISVNVKQTQHLTKKFSQPLTPLPEGQDTMLDMKAVSSRHSVLSQVSLKQRDSPRADTKHDDSDILNLQIEGQALKLPSESARQSSKHAKEPTYSSSQRPIHETKPVSQENPHAANLLIRPVNFQYHPERLGATPVKQDLEIGKNAEKSASIGLNTGRSEDGTVPLLPEGHQVSSNKSPSSFVEEQCPPMEPETKEPKSLPDKDSVTESQGKDNLSSFLVPQRSEDGVNGLQNQELPNVATDAAAKREPVDTASSMSQVTPVSSILEMPKSPVVMVKTSSPTPVKLYSSRPSSSQRSAKLRYTQVFCEL